MTAKRYKGQKKPNTTINNIVSNMASGNMFELFSNVYLEFNDKPPPTYISKCEYQNPNIWGIWGI